MPDQVDEKVLRNVIALLREARQTSATLHDRLLAAEQMLEGYDPTREAKAWWEENWKAKYRSDYQWAFGRDIASIKRLLKSLHLHDLKARMLAYLSSDDRFHVQNHHPFGVFVASINSFGGAIKPPQVVGCLHQPPCRDDVEHTQRTMDERKRRATVVG